MTIADMAEEELSMKLYSHDTDVIGNVIHNIGTGSCPIVEAIYQAILTRGFQ